MSWSFASSFAAAGFVAAEQRVRPGADDERVAGIVPAAFEDGALHRRQNIPFVGAGAGRANGGLEGLVGEFGGASDIDEFSV